MSRGRKRLWMLVGVLAVLVVGVPLVIAAPVATGMVDPGLVTVRVHEKSEGFRLYIPVPALVVDAGLRSAVAAGGLHEMERLPEEARQWMPMARAAVEALVEAPDATLVEVEDGEEHVLVAKRGGRLIVEVRSPDADVDVAVPARLALRVFDTLEGAGYL